MHKNRLEKHGSVDPLPTAYKKNSYGYMVRSYTKANGRPGSQSEHRDVMEMYLGRALVDKENVHHINGVRDDNRIENLELWSTHQPYGQRAKDKLAWAREIIELYEKDEDKL